MNPSVIKVTCVKCKSFRELSLHLHELFMFCELLNNDHPVFKMEKKVKTEVGRAKTVNIAKWLRLASQISSIEMDSFKYEKAHQYCEPVADMLYSNAVHYSSIITPLTRFVFVANALDEAYRFASHVYEDRFDIAKALDPLIERKRDYSMQSSWLLEETLLSADAPLHYGHRVDVFRLLAKQYQANFNVKFSTELECVRGVSYGLSLVRDVRNQVAHGVFPIIDDPEYTFEFSISDNKILIIRLLQLASRVAAMNIQMLLKIANDGFRSLEYQYICDDWKSGGQLEPPCTLGYLDKLHLEQEFGLNESSQWGLDAKLNESSVDG